MLQKRPIYKNLVSKADIARALKTSQWNIWYWINSGVIPAPTHPSYTGKKMLYSESEANKIINNLKPYLLGEEE